MKHDWLKKGSSLLCGTLAAGLLLAACSSGTGPNATPEENANGAGAGTAAKTKIAYWTIDRHDMDYMQEQVDKYNAENTDNIEVEMKVMADNYNQAIEVAFASNQAPDIFRSGDFQTYVSKGYYAQLDTLLGEDFLAKFDGLLVEDIYTKDGHVYTLPNSGQFWRLLYNQDLLEKAGYTEPPATLDEMVEIANKITEQGKAEGVYGFASNFKNGSGFTRPAFASGSLGSSTSHEGFNYQTGEFDFGMYRDVAQALRRIKDNGSMIPGAESLDIDPLRAQFAQGKIGMYINHSSEPAVYASQFPTNIRWSSAIVPTKDGERSGVTWVNAGGYIGISAQSDKQEAAVKFLEYLYDLELRKDYQEKGLGLSVLPYVNEAAGAPELAGIEGFLPTRYDGIYPATPISATETKLEGKKASDVFTEYILTGSPELEGAISDLNARYGKALAAARAEGLTAIKADPSFNSGSLQGTLGQ